MRSVDEIYQEMLAKLAERCGFQPEETCDLAVRLYAAAAQVQALDIQAEWVLDQSFPQTAQGIYLERHAAMRGLKRQEASKASGMLRFCVESASAADLEIPEGSVCMTEEERRFRTTGRGVLKAGELFVDVPAQALEGGSAFNAAPGTITIMTACPVGITACTNPGAFSGGSDPESDESLRARVLESYRRLPNGANAAWYERSAMAHTGVAEAKAVGRARGTGTVDVYIATERGTPDETLLEAVRADLQENREIAVDVQVLAPAQQTVNVTLEAAAENGRDFSAVKAALEQAVTAFFNGHLLGKPVLMAELVSLAFRQEGVENVRLVSPAADIAAGVGVLPVLGTLTVTELGA